MTGMSIEDTTPEPKNLGAIVRDRNGEVWVRTADIYSENETEWVGYSDTGQWSDIPQPVEALHDGWTPPTEEPTNPPTEEPTNPGAVVRDREGRLYRRVEAGIWQWLNAPADIGEGEYADLEWSGWGELRQRDAVLLPDIGAEPAYRDRRFDNLHEHAIRVLHEYQQDGDDPGAIAAAARIVGYAEAIEGDTE